MFDAECIDATSSTPTPNSHLTTPSAPFSPPLQSFTEFGSCVFNLLATLIFISVVQPWFLVGLAPLAVIYYLFQMFYRRSYIELQRNDATSRSPIYAHFSESLSGVETIRAYRMVDVFCASSDNRVDYNHRCGSLGIPRPCTQRCAFHVLKRVF